MSNQIKSNQLISHYLVRIIREKRKNTVNFDTGYITNKNLCESGKVADLSIWLLFIFGDDNVKIMVHFCQQNNYLWLGKPGWKLITT